VLPDVLQDKLPNLATTVAYVGHRDSSYFLLSTKLTSIINIARKIVNIEMRRVIEAKTCSLSHQGIYRDSVRGTDLVLVRTRVLSLDGTSHLLEVQEWGTWCVHIWEQCPTMGGRPSQEFGVAISRPVVHNASLIIAKIVHRRLRLLT
jgi:hypothetical protein